MNFFISPGVFIEGENVVNEGDTAHFEGEVPFRPSLTCVKWQKYQNKEYKDIIMSLNEDKYSGSANDLKRPILKINKACPNDEAEYRLKVVAGGISTYSTVCNLKVLRTLGNLCFCITFGVKSALICHQVHFRL